MWVGPSAGGPGDNWPDTGRSARTRKGADVGQVSLCGNTDNEVGTEGQVRGSSLFRVGGLVDLEPCCDRFRCRCQCFHTGSPGPRQHPFGSGHYVPYPASYPQDRRRRGRPTRPEVSCCLSATGISFSGHPLPARELGLPHGRLTGHKPRARTLTGLPRSTRMRCGRGGCLLYPEGDGTHPADKKSSTGACRSSAAQPLHPAQTTHQRGSHITKHQRRFTRFTRPALPSPVAPMDGTGTLGLEP